MPGLGTSFGRGGATTAQQDLQNADAILIMGSSMAENHPVGFQWVMEARERGAKIIHVDPRFTRTSAMADIWVPLRAGSDIVLLGATRQLRSRKREGFPRIHRALHQCGRDSARRFQRYRRSRRLFSGWDHGEKGIRHQLGRTKMRPEPKRGGARRARRSRQGPRRRKIRRRTSIGPIPRCRIRAASIRF